MRALSIVAAASVIAVAPAAAQSLIDRVEAVRTGSIRLSFPVRDGVCGSGGNIYTTRAGRASDDWESDCDDGPARVVIDRRDGETRDLDTYLGGRWKARRGVTDFGDVSAAAAADLLFALATTSADDVARDAVVALALADAPVGGRLGALARDHDRPTEVRESAVFWVGQLGGDEGLDLLEELIEADPDPDVRDRAVFAVAQHPGERAPRILRRLVEDDTAPARLRERAIFWLGQSRHDGATAFLTGAFTRLRSPALRERILFALSQQRQAESARWLVDEVVLSADVDLGLREKGVFWLGQMPTASDALIDLYDRLESDALRERVIFALSQRRRDDRALEKLMEIAGSDERPPLRKKAIFWLGQSRDPRAVRFLAELIGS